MAGTSAALGTHGCDAARVEVPTSDRLSPWVVATNQPVLIADVRDEVHRHNLLVDPVRFGAYAGAPLVLDRGLAIGVLAASTPEPHAWTQQNGEDLIMLASEVSTWLSLELLRCSDWSPARSGAQ
jgi:GAF domain-containing protein